MILTLNTDGAVLADMKVKHVNLPLTGGPGKHRAGVRSPGHVRLGGRVLYSHWSSSSRYCALIGGVKCPLLGVFCAFCHKDPVKGI